LSIPLWFPKLRSILMHLKIIKFTEMKLNHLKIRWSTELTMI